MLKNLRVSYGRAQIVSDGGSGLGFLTLSRHSRKNLINPLPQAVLVIRGAWRGFNNIDTIQIDSGKFGKLLPLILAEPLFSSNKKLLKARKILVILRKTVLKFKQKPQHIICKLFIRVPYFLAIIYDCKGQDRDGHDRVEHHSAHSERSDGGAPRPNAVLEPPIIDVPDFCGRHQQVDVSGLIFLMAIVTHAKTMNQINRLNNMYILY